MDFVLALVILTFFLPALALVCATLWLVAGPPIFARETCIGRHGLAFARLTFRAEKTSAIAEHLVASGLDGLPQLWNVLRGEVSLIGPRPQPWRRASTVLATARIHVPGLYWPPEWAEDNRP